MLSGLVFHSRIIPSSFDLLSQEFQIEKQISNYTISLKRYSRHRISWPYGKCRTYETHRTSKWPMNALSHTHCYRQCIQYFYKTRFNCIPIFIDNIVYESDFTYQNTSNTEFCLEDTIASMHRFEQRCLRMCPIDCLDVQYSYSIRNYQIRTDINWFKQKRRTFGIKIFWESKQLKFAYIDEPVMIFTEYLVNCGELMGLWFGISAKDIIAIVIKSKIWGKFINLLINMPL